MSSPSSGWRREGSAERYQVMLDIRLTGQDAAQAALFYCASRLGANCFLSHRKFSIKFSPQLHILAPACR